MKKEKLTVAEHEAIAVLLKEAGEKMSAIFNALNGKVQTPMMLRVLKIDTKLFYLKRELEDLVFDEHPDQASYDVYFGEHARPKMEG